MEFANNRKNGRAPRRAARHLRRHARGQAMVEYSAINWLLIVGLLLGATVRVVPTDGDVRKNIVDLFLTALQVYQDSVYYLLNLPFT
ncbi:hypothetical protein P2318_12965 [Myxococcaceae bacterium GXIMD 01537]